MNFQILILPSLSKINNMLYKGTREETWNMLTFLRKLERNKKIPHNKGQKLYQKISPVLVEATFAFNIDVLSPDGFESTEATGCFNVANHTHSN